MKIDKVLVSLERMKKDIATVQDAYEVASALAEARRKEIESLKKEGGMRGRVEQEREKVQGIIAKLEAQLVKRKSIDEWQRTVHENATNKGWHDEERTFGDLIALCHSELSEALEEYRNGRDASEVYYEGEKPCGIPIELADVAIRILDMCGKHGIDLEEAIAEKHEYNTTRARRHGGKVI